MQNGWIKLHRQLLDNIIFKSEKGLKVWIWCLLRAGHDETEVLIGRQIIRLKQGQFIMGGIKAEEVLDIARTTIYYWLDFLAKNGMVDIKKTNKYTVVTIHNWDRFQGVDIKRTSNVTTDGQQKDTNKKKKEEKEEERTLAEDRKNAEHPPYEAVPDPNLFTPAQLRAYEAKHGSRYSTRKTEAPSAEIVAVLDLFAPLNPSYVAMRSWMPQREAADRLLKLYGFEKLQSMIATLVSAFGKEYSPVITSPTALEKKMGDFLFFLKKQKNITSKHNFIL